MLGAFFAQPNFKEVSLSALEPVVPRERLLGPDSRTDKLLLAEARRRLESGPDEVVDIATNDGGIKIEASLWHSQDGLNIFTPANWEPFYEVFEKRMEEEEEQQRLAEEQLISQKENAKARAGWMFQAVLFLLVMILLLTTRLGFVPLWVGLLAGNGWWIYILIRISNKGSS